MDRRSFISHCLSTTVCSWHDIMIVIVIERFPLYSNTVHLELNSFTTLQHENVSVNISVESLCIDKNALSHGSRATHMRQWNSPPLIQIRHQASIWTSAGIMQIRPLGVNFNEISIEIQTFSLHKMHLKMSSRKWRLFCLGLNLLNGHSTTNPNTNRCKFDVYIHWNGSVIALTKLSSLASPEVANCQLSVQPVMKISSKMPTFLFQC